VVDVSMGPDPCPKILVDIEWGFGLLGLFLPVPEWYLRDPYLDRVRLLVNGVWDRSGLVRTDVRYLLDRGGVWGDGWVSQVVGRTGTGG
jgi:hypothetical protein